MCEFELEQIGIQEIAGFSRESTKSHIQRFFSSLGERLRQDPEIAPQIIIPLDGGVFVYQVFLATFPLMGLSYGIEDIAFRFAAKVKKNVYYINPSSDGKSPLIIILDDIADELGAFGNIREQITRPGSAFELWAFSKKESTALYPGNFALAATFPDIWVNSTLGLNSGHFPSTDPITALERLCAVAYSGYPTDPEIYRAILTSNSLFPDVVRSRLFYFLLEISNCPYGEKSRRMQFFHQNYLAGREILDTFHFLS